MANTDGTVEDYKRYNRCEKWKPGVFEKSLTYEGKRRAPKVKAGEVKVNAYNIVDPVSGEVLGHWTEKKEFGLFGTKKDPEYIVTVRKTGKKDPRKFGGDHKFTMNDRDEAVQKAVELLNKEVDAYKDHDFWLSDEFMIESGMYERTEHGTLRMLP